MVRVGADISGVKKGLGEANAAVEEAGSGFSKLGALAAPAGVAVLAAVTGLAVFGERGTDMLPMLNQGRSGIEGLMKSGQQMGAVMSNEQVAAAHKLALEQKQLDTAMSGVTLQIGSFLMPVMTALMGFVTGTAI